MSRDTAEFDVADFENPDDGKGLHARFYIEAEHDAKASAAAGRPIFNDHEYVEILAPGNANNIIRRKARDTDRAKFRANYEKFKAGADDQVTGTLLSEVPWISRSQVEELRFMRIRTIEQLAEVSDSVCGSAAGMHTLKRKAREWVALAENSAAFSAANEQNEALKARMQELEDKLAKLSKPEKPAKDAG